MRVRHWLLLGASALMVSGLSASGCGGSSDSTSPLDAGQDQSVADQAAPPNDTGGGSDVVDTGSACQSDADLNQLNIPDAALADGATSVGICVGCVKSNCSAQFDACNGDPCCTALIGTVLGCIATGGAPIQCGAPLTGSAVPASAQQLGVCLLLACRPQCTGAGGDSGASDASDGGG